MRLIATCLAAAAMLILASTTHASSVQFVIGPGSTVDVSYFGPGSFSSYSVTGSIQADVTGSTLVITSGTLDLVGPGPDTIMTITGGQLSYDGAGSFWDFGQGPSDVGVPAENPGYILNTTGFTGALGDVLGFFIAPGIFSAEGFGLADDSLSHSMTSFFWFGDSAIVVPVPAAIWLFGSALVGLGMARRRVA